MKKRILLTMVGALVISATTFAEDHVMAAAKAPKSDSQTPKSLSLSLKEAQDYAVKQNRSLRNSSLAVQEAYAQRWQTIASMLPQVDGSYSYSNYCGYSASMETAMGSFKIDMPNVGALGVTASMGINGQGIVGVLLNNIAIDMKKIALEQSETQLRGSVMSSYVSVGTAEYCRPVGLQPRQYPGSGEDNSIRRRGRCSRADHGRSDSRAREHVKELNQRAET